MPGGTSHVGVGVGAQAATSAQSLLSLRTDTKSRDTLSPRLRVPKERNTCPMS